MAKSLTSGEIAKHCDVHLRTVIRWIENGRLKGYKLPGRGNNRVKVEDFVAFLKENGMPVPDEYLPESTQTKVLVVDDEETYAKAIARVLRRQGFETELAFDGFQAGAKLASTQPALMTLDLSMPGLDGFEVLRFTREQAQFANLKILVISALGEKKLQRARDLGADATLAKPFENRELVDCVSRLLTAVSPG